MDASNAFNALNRQTALHNIQHLCPSLATILINTYRCSTDLFVDNSILSSQEGTTQGDPLAMPMYALATIPLINCVSGTQTRQVLYADDAAASGTILDLRAWWDKLNSIGPDFGYYANPLKTWLVTKEQHLSQARSVFGSTDVNITSHGRPYLGVPLGSEEFVQEFVSQKVEQ